LIQKKKILIIDDSKDIVTSLVDFLEEHQFVVRYAYDAFGALNIVNELLPDLIICDIFMPGMDGYEFYREIKTEPLTAEIPVIFITAAADKNEVERGKAAGVKHFIIKPYSILHLLDVIKSVLND
jgi:CheY-like chemotaxis protein